VWDPDVPTSQDFRAQWLEVPDTGEFGNGFRTQWVEYLSDVDAGRPHPYDFNAAVRGLQLAEAGLRSSAEGRRIEIERPAR
jgi:predicted dehydrogenase